MYNWRKLQVAPAGEEKGARASNSVLSLLKAGRAVTGRYGKSQPKDLGTIHFVSERDRFILTAIPKSGTKTFRYLFLNDPFFEESVQIVEATLAEVLSEADHADYFKFSFVRNPWGRVVSAWRDKICNAHLVGQLAILSRFQGLKAYMPFDAFVDWLMTEEGSDACADRHWMSQHRLLSGADGNLACDFIGRLENLNADFSTAAKNFGFDLVELPHRNATAKPVGEAPHRKFYSDRTKALVAQRYAEDIGRFGYEF